MSAATRRPASGSRRPNTFARKREAEAELARISHQSGTGMYVRRWDDTVGELLDDYLRTAAFGREANTRLSYENALKPARARLGQCRAQSVTRQDVEDLRDWMLTAGRRRGGKPGTGLGPRSVRLTLGRLSAAFEQACDDGKLYRNPCRGMKLPAEAKPERPQWTEGQVRQMLATEDWLAACWRLALYGLRRGEVAGLRWDDVDLDAATLTVAQTRVVVSQVVTKGPKSRASGRTLPLDEVTVGELRALKARQAAERLEAGEAYTASGYVACDELGAAVSREWLTDEFRRVAARAGLPRIRLHDSRRTINSLMARAGVPPHIRAAWCGHTVAVNEQSYTFAQAQDLALALGAVSKIHSAV
jgi:integrase